MMSIKRRLKAIKKTRLYNFIADSFFYMQRVFFLLVYIIFRPFPLKNRVVASSFSGRKYGGNPKYIIEQIHKGHPEWKLIWIKDNKSVYTVPDYIKAVDGFGFAGSITKYYYYITSKVWIDSHFLYGVARKRKKQIFVETWHGGLGIKKIGMDSEEFSNDRYQVKKMQSTVKLADVFISNSDHLSHIYRSAFAYNGEIIKCGYPENDKLIHGFSQKEKICSLYNIPVKNHILLYAPTFRDGYENGQEIDLSPYNIEYPALKATLEKRFGGTWSIMIRWHPIMERSAVLTDTMAVNVTAYPDIQDLILSCDCMVSDYSSCIFDAAIHKLPCFTYTADLEVYEDGRGVYYKVRELPFPNATNNEELKKIILEFDEHDYQMRWDAFVDKTGLRETGKASETVSEYIFNKIN